MLDPKPGQHLVYDNLFAVNVSLRFIFATLKRILSINAAITFYFPVIRECIIVKGMTYNYYGVHESGSRELQTVVNPLDNRLKPLNTIAR